MYDLIIIGAGPAGLTGAIYALRANLKVLVLEAKNYGGQIINASKIVNYPGIKEISGFDFSQVLYEQVKDFGGLIKFEKVIEVLPDKTVITENNKYQAKEIIIATGLINRKLNLENEDKLLGHGISYCATCDGNFFKGKTVSVVGGGNKALEDALELSNIASKVYLICRRDTFKGDKKYQEELKKKKNVEIILNSTIKKLNGENSLKSILIDTKGKLTTIDTEALFIAIGEIPNNEIFKNIVSLDEDGYIITDDNLKTKTKGIYVAGDNRQKELRQLTTAISDGALAASMVIKDLNN